MKTIGLLCSTLAFAAVAGVCNGVPNEVKVSSFGFDAEDSTEIIQRALDSGARKLVFDRQSGPWITRPLVARSNQEIVFEDEVELVAKKGGFRGIRDYRKLLKDRKEGDGA